MWMPINAIMLNVNALEMERGKKTDSNTPQPGERFANHTTQVNSLLNISHTYKEFLGLSRVFFASNLEHTLICWQQPSCHRCSFGKADLAPKLVPTACSHHGLVPPAASLQPTSLSLHPSAVSFPSPLATAAFLDLETRQLGGIYHFH